MPSATRGEAADAGFDVASPDAAGFLSPSGGFTGWSTEFVTAGAETVSLWGVGLAPGAD
ncbi:MAG: hypothetical protein HRU17_09285 [Polyangiaceae bacterium]|nr:hypothetical protein [Polyangiaceae bacterium]